MSDSTTNPKPGDTLKTEAKTARTEAEKRLGSAGEEIRDTARQTADDMRRHATDMAGGAKDHAAGEANKVADALRDAARNLSDGSPQARALSQIADGLANAASSVEGRDIGELTQDLTQFARRNPVAFLGGAALLGFAASRFARASTAPRPEEGLSDGSLPATGTTDGIPANGTTPAPASPMASPAVAPAGNNDGDY